MAQASQHRDRVRPNKSLRLDGHVCEAQRNDVEDLLVLGLGSDARPRCAVDAVLRGVENDQNEWLLNRLNAKMIQSLLQDLKQHDRRREQGTERPCSG